MGSTDTFSKCSCSIRPMEQTPVQADALARRRRVEDRVYVALGSNLGDREAHLVAALDALQASEGISVLAASRMPAVAMCSSTVPMADISPTRDGSS